MLSNGKLFIVSDPTCLLTWTRTSRVSIIIPRSPVSIPDLASLYPFRSFFESPWVVGGGEFSRSSQPPSRACDVARHLACLLWQVHISTREGTTEYGSRVHYRGEDPSFTTRVDLPNPSHHHRCQLDKAQNPLTTRLQGLKTPFPEQNFSLWQFRGFFAPLRFGRGYWIARLCPHTNRLLLTAAQPSILSAHWREKCRFVVDDLERAYLQLILFFFLFFLSCLFVLVWFVLLSPPLCVVGLASRGTWPEICWHQKSSVVVPTVHHHLLLPPFPLPLWAIGLFPPIKALYRTVLEPKFHEGSSVSWPM